MAEWTLGMIGAGNMNTAILNGVLRRGAVRPEQVWLSNRHGDKLASFSAQGVHTTTDNRAVAAHADLLVLGVKPQMFGDVLPELRDLAAGKCVVSIAAGISAAYLRQELPGAKVVRAMPNTPPDGRGGSYGGGPNGRPVSRGVPAGAGPLCRRWGSGFD